MNQEKIALTLLGLAAELLGNKTSCCGGMKPSPIAAPKKPCTCGCAEHTPKPQKFDQEPDGVQIVVDRPRIENYYGNRQKWAEDMANYRSLIDQAKKCDHIKTRKPDCVPQEVHDNRRDWYDDHGQGLKDIKNKVGCCGWEKEDNCKPKGLYAPEGVCIEGFITGWNPNKNWF